MSVYCIDQHWRTDNDVCPLAAITAYMIARGDNQGPFFIKNDGTPLHKDSFISEIRMAIIVATTVLYYHNTATRYLSFKMAAVSNASLFPTSY